MNNSTTHMGDTPSTMDPLEALDSTPLPDGPLGSTMGALATGLLEAEEHDESWDGDDHPDEDTVGTFFVAEAELGLLARSVREVVPYPKHVTPIPLTPDSFHGVFSLRGEVLPILDAAALLSAEPTVALEDRRVAIVDIGSGHIGVAFDRTGEVLRVESKRCFGLVQSDGKKNGIIDGVIQLDEGSRCIQQLSPSLLGGIPGVPYGEACQAREDAFLDSTVYSKAVAVRVGEYELAFPMEHLVEIQENLVIQNAPKYFDHCIGMLDLRGRVHAVMDFRGALGMARAGETKKLVFLSHEGVTVVLEVDSLVETVEYPEEALLTLPDLPDAGIGDVCDQVLSIDSERHVLLVDVPKLFKRYGIAEGANVLHAADSADADSTVKSTEEDKALFTFALDQQILSIEMERIVEVQSFPEHLIGSQKEEGAVAGMMNLRGRVVPLIDVRKRCGLAPWEPTEQSHDLGQDRPVVIVVEAGGPPFGLIVDRVHSIQRFQPSMASPVESLLNGGSLDQGVLQFVKAALMIERTGGGNDVIMVMDAAKLLDLGGGVPEEEEPLIEVTGMSFD